MVCSFNTKMKRKFNLDQFVFQTMRKHGCVEFMLSKKVKRKLIHEVKKRNNKIFKNKIKI